MAIDTLLLTEGLESLIESDEFADFDEQNRDIAIRSTMAEFATRNGVTPDDEEDIAAINRAASEVNSVFRQRTRKGRYVAEPEQIGRFLSEQNIQFSEGGDEKERLAEIEDARAKIEQNIYKDPVLGMHGGDVNFVLNNLLDQKRRVVKGEDKGRFGSAVSNVLQGGVSRLVTTFGFSDEGVRDFFNENPEFDDEFTQKLASGVGDVAGVMAMIYVAAQTGGTLGGAAATASGASSATAGTIASVSATASGMTASVMSNAIQRYNEAYQNEIAFSGDKERARRAGYDNLPAAAIDTVGDALLSRALIPKATATKIKAARDTKEKIAVLQGAISNPQTFKRVAGSFLAQGSSELAGDYASGQLQYLSTENSAVIPDAEELKDSFLIGGIIGAGGAAGGTKVDTIKSQNQLNQIQQKISQIQKSGNLTPEVEAELKTLTDALGQTKEQNERTQDANRKQSSQQQEPGPIRDQGERQAQGQPSGDVQGQAQDGQGQGQEGLTNPQAQVLSDIIHNQTDQGLRNTELNNAFPARSLVENSLTNPTPEVLDRLDRDALTSENPVEFYERLSTQDGAKVQRELESRVRRNPISVANVTDKVFATQEEANEAAFEVLRAAEGVNINVTADVHPAPTPLVDKGQSIVTVNIDEDLGDNKVDLTGNIFQVENGEFVTQDQEAQIEQAPEPVKPPRVAPQEELDLSTPEEALRFLDRNDHIVDPSSSRVAGVNRWFQRGGLPEVLRRARQEANHHRGIVERGHSPSIRRLQLLQAWDNTVSSLEAQIAQTENSVLPDDVRELSPGSNFTARQQAEGISFLGDQPTDQQQEPAEPQFVKVAGANLRRALETLFSQNFYEGSFVNVAARELLQNMMDAVNRGTKDPFKFAFVDLGFNPEDHLKQLIMAQDNGIGMTPKTVISKFLPAFVTGKEDGPSAGGFGLAKILLLGDVDRFTVRTRAVNEEGDVVETTVSGASDAWLDFAEQEHEMPADMDVAQAEYDYAGLNVSVKFHDFEDRANGPVTGTTYLGFFEESNDKDSKKYLTNLRAPKVYTNTKDFYYQSDNSYIRFTDDTSDLDILDKVDQEYYRAWNESGADPMIDSEVDLSEVDQNVGIDIADYDVQTANLPSANVSVYFHKHDKVKVGWGGFDTIVTNNGMEQFQTTIKTNVSGGVKIPKFVIDVSPKTAATDVNYPFAKSRDKLESGTETFEFVKGLVDSFANAAERARITEIKSTKKEANVQASDGTMVPVVGISRALDQEKFDRILNKPLVKSFADFVVNLKPSLDKFKDVFGEFEIEGISIHPDAYGFRFGTQIKKSKGRIYLNPLALVFGSDGAKNRVLDSNNDYYDDSKSMFEHFEDVLWGVIHHEVSHQLSFSEGEGHARAMTFTSGNMARAFNEMVQALKDSGIDEIALSEFVRDTEVVDIETELSDAHDEDASKNIVKEINKAFEDAASIQILGDRSSKNTTTGQADANQSNIEGESRTSDQDQGSGTRDQANEGETQSGIPEGPQASSGRSELIPTGEGNPSQIFGEGVFYSEEKGNIQYIETDDPESTGETSREEQVEELSGEEGITSEAKSRKDNLRTFQKRGKGRIKTSEDQRLHDALSKALIPNLRAMERQAPDLAVMVHEIIANYNGSRVSRNTTRIPYDLLFAKVRDLPSENQAAAHADGISPEQSLMTYLIEQGDQAFVQDKVERLTRRIPDIDLELPLLADSDELSAKAGDIFPGLLEAFEANLFVADETFSGKDKINAYLARNPAYQRIQTQAQKKTDEQRVKEREQNILFGTELQQDIQNISLDDTVYAGNFQEEQNRIVSEALIGHLKEIDLSTLDDYQLGLHINAIDALAADGTLTHGGVILDQIADNIIKASDINLAAGRFRDSSVSLPFLNRISGLIEGISPTGQKLDRISAFKAGRDFLEQLYAPLNASGIRYDNARLSMEKRLNELTKTHFNGRPTQEQNVRMGMMMQIRQYRAGYNPDAEVATTIANIEESINRAIASAPLASRRFHQMAANQLDAILNGVDRDGDNLALQIEKAFERNLTDAEKAWVAGSIKIFNEWQNDMRFTTEVVRNRPFQEIINYFRTSQIGVDSSIEGSINAIEALDETEFDGANFNAESFGMNSLMRQPSNAKQRTMHLRDGNLYVLSATVLANQAARMTAFEATTAVARRVTINLLNDPAVQEAVNTNPDGTSNPERIKYLRKWFGEEVLNMASQASFAGDVHRWISNWARRVGTLTLSKVHRFVSEPLSAFLDFNIRNAGNLQKQRLLLDAGFRVASPDFANILEQGGIFGRSALGEELLRDQTFNANRFGGKTANKAMDRLDAATHLVSIPLRAGDQFSARSVFLAEYVYAEIQRGAATGFHDVDTDNLNQDSLSIAEINTSKIVNNTRNAARGQFYQNHNKSLNAFRNALFAFTSHGAAMVAQTGTAIRDLAYFARNKNMSSGEISNELKRIGGIMGQSIGFTLGRVAPAFLLITVLRSAHRAADDDDHMQALREQRERLARKKNKTKEDLAQLEDLDNELQLLQGIRDDLRQTERKLKSGEAIAKRMLKDATGNFIMPATLLPNLQDNIFGIFVDPFAEATMSAYKKEEKAKLQAEASIARELGDLENAARLEQAVQDLEGVELIKMGREQFGLPGLAPGVYGIGAQALFDAGHEGSRALAGMGEFDVNDIVLGASAFGLGQGDLNDFFRFQDKVQDSQERLDRREKESERLKQIKDEVRGTKPPKQNIPFDLTF